MRYTLVKDLQGNVIGLADKNGSLAAKYTYDAWGNILSVTDGQGNDVSGNPGHIANVNPLRYRGYYFDQETGFYYLHTRYYDPMAGRFINADGYVTTDSGLSGANMFAYCKNNPVMMTDPDGNKPFYKILEEQANIANAIIEAAKPKPRKSTGQKVSDSLWYVLSGLNAQVGFGSGLGGSATVESINVGLCSKNDLVARVTHGKLDFGKESKSSASIGIESIKYLNLSIQEGFYHSDLCNLYDVYPNPNHDIASCPNTIKYDETPDLSFDIIGVELYCIVGFSFNLSYDFEYVLEGLYGTWS